MEHVYFIAYETEQGAWNGEVVRKSRIATFKDIQDIEEGICKEKGLNQCIITNYIELDRAVNESFIKRMLARRY